MEHEVDLQSLSVSELKDLKTKWYKDADANGDISALYCICRELGTPLRHNYGPKYEFKDEDFSVYVDDYGHYMTVQKGGKLICSTHNEKLFVKPALTDFIKKWYPKAMDKSLAKIKANDDDEKQTLIKELSI